MQGPPPSVLLASRVCDAIAHRTDRAEKSHLSDNRSNHSSKTVIDAPVIILEFFNVANHFVT